MEIVTTTDKERRVEKSSVESERRMRLGMRVTGVC